MSPLLMRALTWPLRLRRRPLLNSSRRTRYPIDSTCLNQKISQESTAQPLKMMKVPHWITPSVWVIPQKHILQKPPVTHWKKVSWVDSSGRYFVPLPKIEVLISCMCLWLVALRITPPEMVVRYGDSVVLNCSVDDPELILVSWETDYGSHEEINPSTSTLTIKKVESWILKPICFAVSTNGFQCTWEPVITVYSTYKWDFLQIFWLLSHGKKFRDELEPLLFSVVDLQRLQTLFQSLQWIPVQW